MDDALPCRLRVASDVFDLAGPAEALRDLAKRLRAAGDVVEQRIRNGAVVQEHTTGDLVVSLRGGPALHVAGSPAALEALWSALEAVAGETPQEGASAPHRHIGQLTVTAEPPVADPLDLL